MLAEIQSRGIEDVLLWFTDLEGHLKSFAITLSEVEGALDDGMGFDGSSITGFNAIEESDMVAIPDPDTFRVLPDGSAGVHDGVSGRTGHGHLLPALGPTAVARAHSRTLEQCGERPVFHRPRQ